MRDVMIITFFVLLHYSWCSAICTNSPPTLDNSNMEMVVASQLAIYTCNSGYGFQSGDAVISSQCIASQWTSFNASCAAGISNSNLTSCSSVSIPNGALLSASNATYYAVFQCKSGAAWFSGVTFRYVRCLDGMWTSMNDLCVTTGSKPPKDCYDIMNSGNTIDGIYSVLPSGTANGVVYQVRCQINKLESTYYGGGWTVILENHGVNMSASNQSYENGFFLNSNTWAGTRFMYEISTATTGGLILDIVMTYAGVNYSATYSSFAVGGPSEGYPLLSVGTYHGNAGDAMSSFVDNQFFFKSGSPNWWGIPSSSNSKTILTARNIFWKSLSNSSVSYVQMRIRPVSYDKGVSCPPVIGYEPFWISNTLANVKNNRMPGTTYSYKCYGDLIFTGYNYTDGSSVAGSVTCIDGVNPTWDASWPLPCKLMCPPNYVMSNTGSFCINFSQSLADGISDAQNQCEAMNASLLMMQYNRDYALAPSSKRYLTTYTLRRLDNYVNEPNYAWLIQNNLGCWNALFNCTCQRPAGSDCSRIWNIGSEFSSCTAPTYFACQRPAYCGNVGVNGQPYFNITGGCYRFIQYTTTVTIRDIYDDCAQEGSALAYPTTVSQMNDLVVTILPILTATYGNQPDYNISLGLNFVNISWASSDSIYAIGDLISRLNPTKSLIWRMAYVKSDGSYSFTAINSSQSLNNVYGLCHYNGPIDCQQIDPPPATDNMLPPIYQYGLWSNITYLCKPGFAVDLLSSQQISQSVTCYGQIGGWIPSTIHPCKEIASPLEYGSCSRSVTTAYQSFIQNMLPLADVSNTSIGAQYPFTCMPGYFVNGITTISTTQQVICAFNLIYGIQWQPTSLQPCLRVPVCNRSLIYQPPDIISFTDYPDSYFLNGNITYHCQNTTATLTKNISQNVTCVETANNTFQFQPCLISCSLCTYPVVVGNATSPWNASLVYSKSSYLMVTCLTNYVFNIWNANTEWAICRDAGWSYSYSTGCYHACTDALPSLGSNMGRAFTGTGQRNAVGSTWRYQCYSGFYYNTTQSFPNVTNTVTVNCNQTAAWFNPRQNDSFVCVQLCLMDPPTASQNGIMYWNGYSRSSSIQVTYSCESGYMLADYSSNKTLTCGGVTWDTFDNASFQCVKVCAMDPPLEPLLSTWDWNNIDRDQGTNVTYVCPSGYLFNNTDSNMTVTCDGQQWNGYRNVTCLQVCTTDPLNSPTNATNNWDGQSRAIGTNVTYSCLTGFLFKGLMNNITVACNGTSWNGYDEQTFFCEKVCPSPPSLTDGINDWNGTSAAAVGANVTYSCSYGYRFTDLSNAKIRTCDGVQWTSIANETLTCIPFCAVNPPPTPSNSKSNWDGSSRSTGDNVTYSCVDGYLFVGSITNFTVTCNGSQWIGINNDTFFCEEACGMNPPNISANATNNWDGSSKTIGTNVSYSCSDGLLFGSINYNLTITCNGSQWIGYDNNRASTCENVCAPPNAPLKNATNWNGNMTQIGNIITYTCNDGYMFTDFRQNIIINCSTSQWSDYANETFHCGKVCNAPPAVVNNATTNFTAQFAWVNQTAAYRCANGFGNYSYNNTGYNIVCQQNGWSSVNNFQCAKICLQNPPPAPPFVSSNFSNNTGEDVMVSYICFGLFQYQTGRQQTVLTSICTNGNWTLQILPRCLTITTPGPTTIPPIVLPTSNVSTLYPDTATTYFGSLNNLHPTSGIANDYALVNSLIGFGQGIYLNSQKDQCMDKSPFATSQSCEINPANCPKGMSFSIWALVLFNDSVYDMTTLTPEDDQYFISTGADMNGHPGIALGIAKQWLFALVSTGSQYWHTKILGQISNNTWNNVGVRWSTTLGMEVYVNATKVGSTQVVNTKAPLPAHSVPTLLLGCQKTSSDTNFTGHFNGYLDEFAMWSSVVPLTNNLSLNFLGGYNQNTSNISPAEFAAMLKNVLINNPAQQAAAVSILTQLSSSPAASPSPSPSPTATGTNASPTSASSAAEQSATVPPASVGNLKTIGNILTMMMDPTKLPTSITAAQAATFLKLSQSFSNVLGPEHSAAWIQIQKSTETVGVMQLVQLFRAWSSKLVQAITWTNESIPFCNEIVTANLYIKYCKMTIGDFGSNYGKVIQLPDYSKPSLQSLRTMWNETLTDRLAFSTQIFPDDRCTDRAVSYVFHYYGFAHLAAVSIANPMYVSSSAFTSVDSRLMNVDITSDPAYDEFGNIDTSQPLCNFDAEAMYAHQLISKNTHINNNAAKVTPRKLMLFENMTVSDVQQRYCVFWNENLTDYGAWDSSNCAISEDAREYSKCACNSFGVISILAVKSEPIEVPDEPKWIFIVKYIFYGLSVFAIIIYITIVMISGDLKDQFHLCGLHLAIAILLGSIAMVLSDFDSIQSSRSSCTLIGTVMQICYGAVGMWILGLGHASFNAITAGIIGGRLLSYSTICWGVPLALSGLPFLFMLSQMGYDPRCFMGWDNIVKWVFFAPQMACAFLATFFAFVILCNLSTPALRKENLIKDYGTFCRGAAILILYLSVTWLFGLLTYMRFSFNGPNFYPIFQVLNSLSGVCLLVLIGFGSERFRSILAGQAQARHEMLRQYAFGLPNDADYPSSKNIPANTSSSASTANLVPEEQKHEPEGANKDF